MNQLQHIWCSVFVALLSFTWQFTARAQAQSANNAESVWQDCRTSR